MSTRAWEPGEMVALGDRLRVLLGFRVGAALAVVGFVAATASAADAALLRLTLAYLTVGLLVDVVWRRLRRRSLALVSAMLMVDGLYLVTVAQLTGANDSPLRNLAIVHLIAVTLLASHRTGLKLALWHSLLLFVAHALQESGVLAAPLASSPAGTSYQRLLVFVAVFWAVAIATASFSAVNERELRRRRYDLESLAELSLRLESATESRTVARVLVEGVLDTFGYSRALVLGVVGDELTTLAAEGTSPGPETWAPGRLSLLTNAGARHRTLLATALDAESDAELALHLPAARNLVVVPMYAEGRAVGLLVAEHGMPTASRAERRAISMTERFAAQAGLALSNATLLEQVRATAALDGLTGIANRRTFDQTLEQALARTARSGLPVSLILVDLDHFKRLNDEHGHQTGDEVLRHVARVLTAGCRSGDTAARYGGEEFVVVMPDSSAADAVEVAERIRVMVRNAPTPVPVTVSLGVATTTGREVDATALIEEADVHLYAAKRAGRDRVGAGLVTSMPLPRVPTA